VGVNVAFLSLTGDEDDDDQQRSDSKPPQVKRRQSVFSKLGSTRLKKVYTGILHFPVISPCISPGAAAPLLIL